MLIICIPHNIQHSARYMEVLDIYGIMEFYSEELAKLKGIFYLLILFVQYIPVEYLSRIVHRMIPLHSHSNMLLITFFSSGVYTITQLVPVPHWLQSANPLTFLMICDLIIQYFSHLNVLLIAVLRTKYIQLNLFIFYICF